MTATPSRLPTVPEGVLRAVEQRYDLGTVELREPLAGGVANDVAVVESAAGSLVLRLKFPPSDPASISWEHDLVARLAGELPEVVAPLRARDGSTFFLWAGDAVWLVPYVEALPATPDCEQHRLAAARLLGRLHAVTAKLGLAPRPHAEGIAQLRSLDARALPPKWRRRVVRLHGEALNLLARLERRRPTAGVLHGDFFRGNVLVRDDRVVALIDWEEAHVGPLVFELANGMWEFTKSETAHDFDRAAGRRFVDAYRAAGGSVPPDEENLIVPLIRAKRVLELLRSPTDRSVDWDYQEHNLRAAETLA